MYERFYGLEERPFSITPDPRFVFLSRRHEDALAHLLYGVGRGGSGGFVQLTGEIGTGKTTLCRLMLDQVPEHTQIALILNPMLEPRELMRAICRELGAELPDRDAGLEDVGQCLNERLLQIHADGERAVLIIDEAQNMSRETLEQVRLLTNLETETDKLLQIILLGQPELRELLSRPSLRQLAQRITARYHLAPLVASETAEYVRHRIRVAGGPRCPFPAAALRTLHRVSGGVPRLINIIADRSLMAGYARESDRITPAMVRKAASEVVVGDESGGSRRTAAVLAGVAVAAVIAVAATMVWSLRSVPVQQESVHTPLWREMLPLATADAAWREVAALYPGVGVDQVVEACAEGDADGLACQRMRGNWTLLRRLDRPIVLRLESPAFGHVFAPEIRESNLLLRHSGQDIQVPIADFESTWLGDFFVVWLDDGAVWSVGDRDSAVAELKRLAASVSDGPWSGSRDDLYTEDFADWVRAFQRRSGLREDGVAGPVTRLFVTTFARPVAESADARS